MVYYFFLFKQKTAYEMRISDWSSDVCSSDLGRERIELLDADDGGVLVARLVARFDQVVGDLARAEDEPLDVLVRRRRRIGQDAAEVAVAGEVPGARPGHLVPQQRLRRHDHQRLAEIPVPLPAEQGEIIGRRGAARGRAAGRERVGQD